MSMTTGTMLTEVTTDTVAMGSFILSVLKNLDASAVLAAWIAIFICCALLRHKVRPNNDTGAESCCPKRRARSIKCIKRCDRRKASNGDSNWSCPFECAFAKIHMPAPLPFRKKKRFKAVKTTSGTVCRPQAEDLCKVNPVADVLPTEDYSSRPSTTLSRNTKRRHRRKRLDSLSASESEASNSRDGHETASSLPLSPSSLLDLALMQNWPQLLVNLKANRRDARQRDIDGLYPLHWAVAGAPPLEVVSALLRAYPGAAKKCDSEGSNALHFASHYGGSVAIVDLLLETYPKAVSVKDKYGRSPLYHAVDKSANIEVLKILATADPVMITVPCQPKNGKVLEQSFLTPLYLAWVNVLTDKQSVESCSGKTWDKARLLLDIAYRHKHGLPQTTDTSKIPLLSAIIDLDDLVPEELAEVVIQKATRRELLQVDPLSGKNLLAFVASLTRISPGRSDELIRLLVEACPDAATEMDRDGRSPLANFAASGKTWDAGLERLFRAAPDALGWVDKTTGLPPALLAASSAPANHPDQRKLPMLLADPYSLMGIKALASRRRALEQKQRLKKATDHNEGPADPNMAHLSNVYRLLIEDPTWISKT